MELGKGSEGIWVQKRDLEILNFCLEMKFADVESLHQKFFDANSLDMFGARKRVQKLEAYGLLRSVSLLGTYFHEVPFLHLKSGNNSTKDWHPQLSTRFGISTRF